MTGIHIDLIHTTKLKWFKILNIINITLTKIKAISNFLLDIKTFF